MYWTQAVTLRALPSHRQQDRPVWEVSIDGRVIGWLREQMIGKSSVVFISAMGVYKLTGQRVDLQNSSDFRRSLEKLIQFDQDPESFRGVHLH